MEDLLEGVKNYSIAVKKRGDDITFLRRIIPGGADDSYGIEVAKLAGIPQSIISRAKEILSDLESGKSDVVVERKIQPQEELPLTLMSTAVSPVAEKLKNTDINTLTPIEALNLIYELKGMI
jgi:DNA mismatch repair protein MutS